MGLGFYRDEPCLCSAYDMDSAEYRSCALKVDKLVHPDLHFVFPVNTTDSVKKHPVSNQFLEEWRAFVMANPYGSMFEWLQQLGIENKQNRIEQFQAIRNDEPQTGHDTAEDQQQVRAADARQDHAAPADETVLADPGMQVETTGPVMSQDPCLEGDVGAGAHMHTDRESPVESGRQRELRRRVDVHAPDPDKNRSAQANEQVAEP